MCPRLKVFRKSKCLSKIYLNLLFAQIERAHRSLINYACKMGRVRDEAALEWDGFSSGSLSRELLARARTKSMVLPHRFCGTNEPCSRTASAKITGLSCLVVVSL